MELGRHSNNHVIVVGVEVTTLGHIKTKWRLVVVTGKQVVRVVSETGDITAALESSGGHTPRLAPFASWTVLYGGHMRSLMTRCLSEMLHGNIQFMETCSG